MTTNEKQLSEGEMIAEELNDMFIDECLPPLPGRIGLWLANRITGAVNAARPETQAAADVLAERRRQVEVAGWTPEHDNCHDKGEMARAAGCYAILAGGMDPPVTRVWPWSREWWKPAGSRRMLVKAGALILAEIERQDRRARGVMLPHEYKRVDDPPPSP